MKRISIFILLMALLAACGGNGASPSATESDPDPTAEPTPSDEASEEPGATAGTGFEGDLSEVIPDELNGVARTDVPGMDAIIGQALIQQGIAASDAQWVFTSYGEGTDSVILNAFAVAGMTDASLDLLARSMAGVGLPGAGEVDPETVTIDGKTVLKMSGGAAAQSGSVYIYFADGAAFTVISQNEGLAEQLLSELP